MQGLKHRIAAGVLVLKDDKVLLVRHRKPGAYDFWVAPGGGVIGNEDLPAAARREAREEAGIEVLPRKLAYIEELINPEMRQCKFWFLAEYVSGTLSPEGEEAKTEFISEARFFSQAEIGNLRVFPPVLKSGFWGDLKAGFREPKYLGVREMEPHRE